MEAGRLPRPGTVRVVECRLAFWRRASCFRGMLLVSDGQQPQHVARGLPPPELLFALRQDAGKHSERIQQVVQCTVVPGKRPYSQITDKLLSSQCDVLEVVKTPGIGFEADLSQPCRQALEPLFISRERS